MLPDGECSHSCRPALALRLRILHQAPIGLLAVDTRHLAAFHLVAAPIENFPGVGQLVIEPDYGVFNHLSGLPAGLAGHLVKLCLHVGFEMHFHGFGSFSHGTSIRLAEARYFLLDWNSFSMLAITLGMSSGRRTIS